MCKPIFSKIVSLFAEHNDLQYAAPGGLIGKDFPELFIRGIMVFFMGTGLHRKIEIFNWIFLIIEWSGGTYMWFSC